MARLIVNPNASRVSPERVAAVVQELERAGPVEVVETRARGDAERLAAEAADVIYVFSGDGGFNEVLNGLAPDVPVGFLPGGGTSVLPRALGLPRDPVACARLYAERRQTRRISLGRVNGRRFAFSAGVGLDSAAVRRVDALGRSPDGRRPGDLAFAAAFVRLFRESGGRIDPEIDVLGVGRAAWVFVANADPYTYAGRVPIHVSPSARFELGLDLVALPEVSLRTLPRILRHGLFGRGLEETGDLLYRHDADRFEIHCDRPLPLQTDGEDLGDVAEAVFEAERDAVTVLV